MNCKIEKSVYQFETFQFKGKDLFQGVIAGIVKPCSHEPDSLITIGGRSIAKFINEFSGRKVWCVWAVNDTFLNPSEIQEEHIKKFTGSASANYGAVYSELTGYLWTDDEGKIGGHDLVESMSGYTNKYGFICIRENPIDLSHVTFTE